MQRSIPFALGALLLGCAIGPAQAQYMNPNYGYSGYSNGYGGNAGYYNGGYGNTGYGNAGYYNNGYGTPSYGYNGYARPASNYYPTVQAPTATYAVPSNPPAYQQMPTAPAMRPVVQAMPTAAPQAQVAVQAAPAIQTNATPATPTVQATPTAQAMPTGTAPAAPAAPHVDCVIVEGAPCPCPEQACPQPQMVPAYAGPPPEGKSCCGKGCDKDCCKDPCVGLELFFGFDAWRGISDHDFPDNAGLRTGANFGFAILPKWGIGGQVGGSFGGYNWDGQDNAINSTSAWQTQEFVTVGIFKRSDIGWPIGFALVYDRMFNESFSDNGRDFNLGQYRGALWVQVSENNEVGFWGALRSGRSTVGGDIFTGVSQYNAFWRHWFCGGGNMTLYGGATDDTRHGIGTGSLGTWIAGANVQVPLTEHIGIYGSLAYMRPSAAPGSTAALQNSYNISLGVVITPFNCLKQRSGCKQGWLPQMPVANNGTFFVDGNF